MERKSIVKKLGNIFYWMLLLFVLIVGIIPMMSVLNLPLPFKMFSVQTGSMKPTIQVGDVIFVREKEQYNVGDVITYVEKRSNTEVVVTHRIENINQDGTFTTRGDFNSISDINPVSKESIIGSYFFRVPLLGYPVDLVRTVPGFILLIIIPSIIIMYEEIKKIKYEIQYRRNMKYYRKIYKQRS